MKSCEGCKNVFDHHTSKPCRSCRYKDDRPNWTASKYIAELIEAAERKAFQAGWEKAIDLYEAGELRGYTREDFEKFKEKSK